ncbi:Protein of unknown function [Pyronema omphalodes CBS 100304]|uniref:Uncharacterized protein n=1 Tax=Pyronema omphalodes (strain CBS 100304) TaxID=1076935 RepID=U4LDN9_PYROM|nr:Protein of unknown function [Pyronema omphalodes CBS 100304]
MRGVDGGRGVSLFRALISTLVVVTATRQQGCIRD